MGILALTGRTPAEGVGVLLAKAGMRQDPVLPTRWTFPDTIARQSQHSAVSFIVDSVKELGEEVVLDLNLGHPAEPEPVHLFDADPAVTRVQVTQGLTGAVNAEHHGPDDGLARAVLISCGFRPAGEAMRLIRVDGEEEHYAAKAVTALREAGFTVTADPHLDPSQEYSEADQEWVDYPMPWLTREEVLQVSADAQRIFEDIHSGRLLVHAHAFDGDIPVAVATYLGGDTVVLHGSDHLRQEIESHADPLHVLESFARQYGVTMAPGPAPRTMAEQLVCLDPAARIAERTTNRPSNGSATGTSPAAGQPRPHR